MLKNIISLSNAANAEESASASEELSGQAQSLSMIVTELAGIVEGKRNRSNSGGQYQKRSFDSVPKTIHGDRHQLNMIGSNRVNRREPALIHGGIGKETTTDSCLFV